MTSILVTNNNDVYIPEIFSQICNDRYEEWCCKTLRQGIWGGETEACLIHLLYEIRITMINPLFQTTTSTSHLNYVRGYLTDPSHTRNFEEIIDSVTIFHHTSGDMKNRNTRFNHFGFLSQR